MTALWKSTLLFTLVALASSARAQSTLPTSTSAADQPTVLVVMGAQGAPEFGQEFTKWAARWAQAAKTRSAQYLQIGREGPEDEAQDDDKSKLKAALDRLPKEGTAALWIIFIGHGTYDGKEAKFNLRGPDVTDVEIAEWLKPFHRPLAVIDCSSSSAPFLNRLSGSGRVIVTATRTGSEVQLAHFGEYLSAAITDPAADLDKDGEISLLEAFIAGSHRTTEFYKQAARLATEHALLDDNGDALGISADWFEGIRATRAARDGAPIDGARAHQWILVLSPSELAMPAETRARRDQLELQIESLRARKKSLPAKEYYAQLEPVLLELARLYGQASPATRPAPTPEVPGIPVP